MRLIKCWVLQCVFFLAPVRAVAQNFDIDLLKSINEKESSFKNDLFTGTTQTVTFFSVAAPAGVFTAGLLKHDKQLQKDGVYMLGGAATAAIITYSMKKVIQRDRPFITYPSIKKRVEEDGYSFPSGHTSAAFCTATSLSLKFPKWYVIVPSYLYAATVAYARMYQGVHYPTDVLAGAVTGAGSAWLSYEVEKWVAKRQAVKKVNYAGF